jgi:hypothetical protein
MFVMFVFWRVRGGVLLGAWGLAALANLSACVHVQPYQRERLAHDTMTTGDWGGPGEIHARSVREGATGGGSAAEAGCGCN